MLQLKRGTALAAALLGLTACDKPLAQSDCTALLDHYVDLLAHADHPDAGGDEVIRLQSAAREKAAQDPQFARCVSEVSRRQFDCAMQATNPDALEQCLL